MNIFQYFVKTSEELEIIVKVLKNKNYKNSYYSDLSYYNKNWDTYRYIKLDNKWKTVSRYSLPLVNATIIGNLEEFISIIKGENQMAKVKSGKYIVGSVNKNNEDLSFASFPATHESQEIAEQEASRLAGQRKDRKFVVCKVVSICSVQDVNWE